MCSKQKIKTTFTFPTFWGQNVKVVLFLIFGHFDHFLSICFMVEEISKYLKKSISSLFDENKMC